MLSVLEPHLSNSLSCRFVKTQLIHGARCKDEKRMVYTVFLHSKAYVFAFVRFVFALTNLWYHVVLERLRFKFALRGSRHFRTGVNLLVPTSSN